MELLQGPTDTRDFEEPYTGHHVSLRNWGSFSGLFNLVTKRVLNQKLEDSFV